MAASRLKPQITANYPQKIDIALGAFESRVDIDEIKNRLSLKPSHIITPLMFQYRLFEWAKRKNKKSSFQKAMMNGYCGQQRY